MDVDLFHRLRTHGYGILLLRTHATAATPSFGVQTHWTQATVGLFTNEIYTPGAHLDDVMSGGVSRVAYTAEQWNTTHQTQYAIRPEFVRDQSGRFMGTWVIAMGCRTTENDSMANAFLSKGAGAYVGWKQTVTAHWTDEVTAFLLNAVLAENHTVEEAVHKARDAWGPDPTYGGNVEVRGVPGFRPNMPAAALNAGAGSAEEASSER